MKTKKGRPKKKIQSLEDRKKRYGAVASDYDYQETTRFIDVTKPVTLEDLGLMLPEQPPTQVVSVRLPTDLLNELKALGSQKDVPYQALIKLFLFEAIRREKKAS